MATRPDFLVVGGGFAGLSAAWQLAPLGSVQVLEREAFACTHSSGRNAAIFLHLSESPGDTQLALRSRPLLDEVAPGWCAPTGLVLTAAKAEALAPLAALAKREGVAAEPLDGQALMDAVPALVGGSERFGLLCPDDGVIDIHLVAQGLERAAKARGARLSFGVDVAQVLREGGRAVGVTLASGEKLEAGNVVLCGGAWASQLGATVEAPLPLVPLRRHLVTLDAPAALAGGRVVWSVDGDVYFREESGGLLVSPCDETAWPAELPAADPEALEVLAQRLERVAPALSNAGVKRSWACLRTFFTVDRAAVVGADPRLAGLWWLAGLGGHGMTGGLAAGEVLAALVAGKGDALAPTLAVQRLLTGLAAP